MTVIDLTTLADDIGGSKLRSATITARATRPRSAGKNLTVPDVVTLKVRNGEPVEPFELEAPDGTWAWEISVLPLGWSKRDAITGIYRFTGAEVNWADLVPVDPKTLVPLVPFPPTVQQVLDLATDKAQAAATSATNAAAAQASSAGFASAASAAANRADEAVEEVPALVVEALATQSISDAVSEWWCHPVATYQDSPYPRTVYGAVSADVGDGTARIVIGEFNHATRTTRRYVIASCTVDDHNSPALNMEGRLPVVFWTNHNADNIIHAKVGTASSDLGSFVGAADQSIDTGAQAAYTEVHLIRSDATTDFYMVFSRRTNYQWDVYVVSVHVPSRTLSWGPRQRFIQATDNNQMYISTAKAYNPTGDPIIRVGAGYNPTAAKHAIYYFELNTVTGAIRTPLSTGFAATLGGATYPVIDNMGVTPLIPEATAGMSRRFFYVRSGPDIPAVSYGDYTIGQTQAMTYKVTEIGTPTPAYLSPGTPGTGRAEAVHDVSMNNVDGYEVKVVARFSGAPSAAAGLARRYASSTNAQFQLNIGTDRKLTFLVTRGGGNGTFTSTDVVPGAWTDTIGYGMRVVKSEAKVYPLYSLDGGTTWTALTGIDITNGSTGLPTTTTAPLVVGTTNAAQRVPAQIFGATFTTLTGALIAGFTSFANWATTDPAGRSWSLIGDAAIMPAANGQITTPFGLSGIPFGGGSQDSYVAGMAFPSPSYDRSVLTAHSSGTVEEVRKHRPSVDGFFTEVIRSQPTEDGRLIRPYPPLNGGGIDALVTNLTHYGESGFTDYRGDLVAV